MFFRSPQRIPSPPSPIVKEVLLDLFIGDDRDAGTGGVGAMQLNHALQRLNEAIAAAPPERREQLTDHCARRLAARIDRLASDLLYRL